MDKHVIRSVRSEMRSLNLTINVLAKAHNASERDQWRHTIESMDLQNLS